jgi:hypothetical protein
VSLPAAAAKVLALLASLPLEHLPPGSQHPLRNFSGGGQAKADDSISSALSMSMDDSISGDAAAMSASAADHDTSIDAAADAHGSDTGAGRAVMGGGGGGGGGPLGYGMEPIDYSTGPLARAKEGIRAAEVAGAAAVAAAAGALDADAAGPATRGWADWDPQWSVSLGALLPLALRIAASDLSGSVSQQQQQQQQNDAGQMGGGNGIAGSNVLAQGPWLTVTRLLGMATCQLHRPSREALEGLRTAMGGTEGDMVAAVLRWRPALVTTACCAANQQLGSGDPRLLPIVVNCMLALLRSGAAARAGVDVSGWVLELIECCPEDVIPAGACELVETFARMSTSTPAGAGAGGAGAGAGASLSSSFALPAMLPLSADRVVAIVTDPGLDRSVATGPHSAAASSAGGSYPATSRVLMLLYAAARASVPVVPGGKFEPWSLLFRCLEHCGARGLIAEAAATVAAVDTGYSALPPPAASSLARAASRLESLLVATAPQLFGAEAFFATEAAAAAVGESTHVGRGGIASSAALVERVLARADLDGGSGASGASSGSSANGASSGSGASNDALPLVAAAITAMRTVAASPELCKRYLSRLARRVFPPAWRAAVTLSLEAAGSVFFFFCFVFFFFFGFLVFWGV